MASISANGSLGHHKFTLTVSESATSVANNTSTVKYTFQLSPVQTSWAWEQWGSSISYTININGTKYTGTIPNYDGYATVTLKSGTQTVTHSSDGSKSISYSFSVTDGAGQRYTPGNASASGTLALTTIPRATTPTLSAMEVVANGTNSVTIKVAPASSTFKHKIRYSFGAYDKIASGVSIGTDFSAKGNVDIKFTPPVSLCNQIPHKTGDLCEIFCYTYTSDGTLIDRTSVKLTIKVPDYTPTATAKFTGNNLLSGAYVQGKSTATVEITASSSYGATIKSYSSTIDGKTYTQSKFTTSVLSKGTKSFSATITDSRGKIFTLSAPEFATVYEYFTPSITGFTVERQADETTVIATVKGSIAAVNNKNAKTITVTLNGVTQTITSSSYTINGSTTFTNVPTDNTLTCTAKLTDSYTYATKDVVLPTVAVTMDFYKSGKGIAMGKVAEKESLLDVAWTIKGAGYKSQRGTRVESANISPEEKYLGSMEHYLASSAMTTGKPSSVDGTENPDGFILHFHWDNDLGYDSQMFIRNSTGSIATRGCKAKTWGAWKQMIDTSMCQDYIVEQGTNNYWTYRKWNSGVAECWKTVDTSTGAFSGSTPTFYSTPGTTFDYPTNFFKSVKSVQLTVTENSGAVLSAFNCSGTDVKHCEPGYLRLYGGSSSVEVKISFHIIGTWK